MKPTVKTVEIWALMGIHAQDTKHGGSWRLSVLFSALDHTTECNHVMGICKGGSGKIERARLQAEAEALGVKRSTFYSWLADAIQFKIFNQSGAFLYIASQAKLSAIFLCNTIDEHKTTIPARLLFKAGWKAIVWAAYVKANHSTVTGYTDKPNGSTQPKLILKKRRSDGKPTLELSYPVRVGDTVSRHTLENVTGVSPRSQRRHNQFVKSKQGIAITNTPGSRETAEALNRAAKDHGQDRHYFVFNDPEQIDPAGIKDYARVIAFTTPSKHEVKDQHATIGAKGKRRQILASIKRLRLVQFCNYPDSLLARPRQATVKTANSETFIPFDRRYHETEAQKEKCPLVGDVLLLRRRGKSRNIYEAIFNA